MKRFVLITFLCLPFFLKAQYWEAGLFFGASNYNGEFTEQFVKMKQTHFAYGGLVRLNLHRNFALKANLYKGLISGTDADARQFYARRWDRNLSFQSKLLDLGLQAEVNLSGYRTGHHVYKSAPYLFVGVSMLRFNPQAEYNGKLINLQPLGTEGQFLTQYKDRYYSLTQFVIPFGFGWKFSLGKYLNMGFELGARKTFTDYLDDVSNTYVDLGDLERRNGSMAKVLSNRTGEVNDNLIEYDDTKLRGNPDTKDWYYFTGFTLTYSFLPIGCMKY